MWKKNSLNCWSFFCCCSIYADDNDKRREKLRVIPSKWIQCSHQVCLNIISLKIYWLNLFKEIEDENFFFSICHQVVLPSAISADSFNEKENRMNIGWREWEGMRKKQNTERINLDIDSTFATWQDSSFMSFKLYLYDY